MSSGMYPSWCANTNSTGSDFFGDLMIIQTRWHEMIRPGVWHITMVHKSHFHSYHCVMDNFGTLIPID